MDESAVRLRFGSPCDPGSSIGDSPPFPPSIGSACQALPGPVGTAHVQEPSSFDPLTTGQVYSPNLLPNTFLQNSRRDGQHRGNPGEQGAGGRGGHDSKSHRAGPVPRPWSSRPVFVDKELRAGVASVRGGQPPRPGLLPLDSGRRLFMPCSSQHLHRRPEPGAAASGGSLLITCGGSPFLPAKFANLAAPRCITLQQWYASGEYKVTRATFCIYNAFKRVDVRCEASFPGHVRTYYVDGSGKVTENVPEDIWGQAFLCSLIRALQPPHPLLCIKILPPPPLHLDNTFLELAKRFFWEGKTLSTSEVGSNCAPDPIAPTAHCQLRLCIGESFALWNSKLRWPIISLSLFPPKAWRLRAC